MLSMLDTGAWFTETPRTEKASQNSRPLRTLWIHLNHYGPMRHASQLMKLAVAAAVIVRVE